jgi:hypothetical protein
MKRHSGAEIHIVFSSQYEYRPDPGIVPGDGPPVSPSLPVSAFAVVVSGHAAPAQALSKNSPE